MTLILPLRKVTSVHKDVTERLMRINPVLAREVRGILDEPKKGDNNILYDNFYYFRAIYSFSLIVNTLSKK